MSVSRIWFHFQALLLQARGPSSAVAASLQRHAGWVPDLHFCLRRRAWSYFFFFFCPFDCQITYLLRPRDHFSEQRYRWGRLFFLKFHTAPRKAKCVAITGHLTLCSKHHRRQAQAARAAGRIGECHSCLGILKLYWILGTPGARAGVHTTN